MGRPKLDDPDRRRPVTCMLHPDSIRRLTFLTKVWGMSQGKVLDKILRETAPDADGDVALWFWQ